MKSSVTLLFALLVVAGSARAADRVLGSGLHQLRRGAREWDDFPLNPEGPRLALRFAAKKNDSEWTLRLRQQDVKQVWRVVLNGKELGRLAQDENDTVIYFPVPPGRLVDGENTLAVEPMGNVPDDVRVGDVRLDDRPVKAILAEATVEVTIMDGKALLPCRLTVVSADGALMTLGVSSGGGLAVRPGVIYTGTGKARFTLPAGEYTVYAGRGFEYGIDSVRLTLKPGDNVQKSLTVRREVPTEGWVSCDTHVHTLTYSGHGDATIDERVITIAGEGLELPVATEHNRQVDYEPAAVKHGVRRYFTPVVGNEVTTPVGHFNIFPVPLGGPPPAHEHKSWAPLFDAIGRTGAKVVVFNHPRDLHLGYRPLGPEHHNAATGDNLDGWELKANAMEVINSGAQQTDPLQLFHDWMTQLNHGRLLTPVGASDSHDVSRYIVGQGRTYIRCPDDDPGRIDVGKAAESFRAGHVMVSCGLLAEITVNDRYGPGDLVPVKGPVQVKVRVLGPGWVTADRVELYANGRKVREAIITDGRKGGVKWEGSWNVSRLTHDFHLEALATGPSVRELYWPIARPYQPTSPRVDRRVLGASGAVWLDVDGDGEPTCARTYAQRLVDAAKGDLPRLLRSLQGYDESVVVQAAGLLQVRGVSIQDEAVRSAVRQAGPEIERGFRTFFAAWRESQIARTGR